MKNTIRQKLPFWAGVFAATFALTTLLVSICLFHRGTSIGLPKASHPVISEQPREDMVSQLQRGGDASEELLDPVTFERRDHRADRNFAFSSDGKRLAPAMQTEPIKTGDILSRGAISRSESPFPRGFSFAPSLGRQRPTVGSGDSGRMIIVDLFETSVR
ncbi:MAG: hypothetical protein WKF77_30400 [Planctomycetaceae bacterium]